MTNSATISAATRRQLVMCEAATELFALDVFTVERVLRYAVPRHLPNSAAWLNGVITVGDRLVPVLDLRERLGLPAPPVPESARIVVVSLEDGAIGLVVDAVHEVTSVEPSSIEEAPSVYRGLAREFVLGIVRRGERLHVLLDVARLVTSTERIAMRDAVAQGAHDGR
jgi:purine-binding chemotaxis protein CheW